MDRETRQKIMEFPVERVTYMSEFVSLEGEGRDLKLRVGTKDEAAKIVAAALSITDGTSTLIIQRAIASAQKVVFEGEECFGSPLFMALKITVAGVTTTREIRR